MKDANLLIHIGLHKTGTTWLQENFFRGNPDYFIPVGGSPKMFASNFIYGRGDYRNSYAFDQYAIREKYEEFLKSESDLEGKWLLISDEDLSGNVWSGGATARRIADDLHSVFPEAKILISIREQIEAISSSFLHFRLAGGCARLEDYLTPGNEFQIPLFNPEFYNYWEVYSYYRNLYGAENVKLLPMELLKVDTEKYKESICRFLGQSSSDMTVLSRKRVNSSDLKLFWVYDHLRLSGLLRQSRNFSGRVSVFGRKHRYRCGLVLEVVSRFLSKFVPKGLANHRREKIQKRIRQELYRTGMLSIYRRGNALLENECDLAFPEYGYQLPE